MSTDDCSLPPLHISLTLIVARCSPVHPTCQGKPSHVSGKTIPRVRENCPIEGAEQRQLAAKEMLWDFDWRKNSLTLTKCRPIRHILVKSRSADDGVDSHFKPRCHNPQSFRPVIGNANPRHSPPLKGENLSSQWHVHSRWEERRAIIAMATTTAHRVVGHVPTLSDEVARWTRSYTKRPQCREYSGISCTADEGWEAGTDGGIKAGITGDSDNRENSIATFSEQRPV
ncbi:hypothetical protein BaRGS_00030676 [Batillaria attramentaria]|uniref:Uncharacterized protein n=1 Tax=Batillaria attramentaria TaxID=370345 RepID=A0ABD0JHL9_9CAEN